MSESGIDLVWIKPRFAILWDDRSGDGDGRKEWRGRQGGHLDVEGGVMGSLICRFHYVGQRTFFGRWLMVDVLIAGRVELGWRYNIFDEIGLRPYLVSM